EGVRVVGLTWQDVEDIGFELSQAYPDEDPKQVPMPELLRLVTELDDFEDDPEKVDELTLERIAAAWAEEFAHQA
ncbi:MAG TPA: Fe-S cluster assembly protein IscX, partial [Candidatus Eremiobacteraceae bacterium]|nr:Fe-S cluster assembly protein IscX [Candidatus Eremiobacteraceae bacterium]